MNRCPRFRLCCVSVSIRYR